MHSYLGVVRFREAPMAESHQEAAAAGAGRSPAAPIADRTTNLAHPPILVVVMPAKAGIQSGRALASTLKPKCDGGPS